MVKCKLCGKPIEDSLDIYCGFCDKIIGDANSDMAAEFEG